jgi:mRNA interferase MazF
MRRIYLARLDKIRPVLLLTREIVVPHLNAVTVAPITSRIRGLSTELPVGPANGLDHDSVVSLDNVQTIATADLIRHIGWLAPRSEAALAVCIAAAFDLDTEPPGHDR